MMNTDMFTYDIDQGSRAFFILLKFSLILLPIFISRTRLMVCLTEVPSRSSLEVNLMMNSRKDLCSKTAFLSFSSSYCKNFIWFYFPKSENSFCPSSSKPVAQTDPEKSFNSTFSLYFGIVYVITFSQLTHLL